MKKGLLKLKLVGLDGNAFSLLGHFRAQATKEGWPKEEVDKVLTEARSGDYVQRRVKMGKIDVRIEWKDKRIFDAQDVKNVLDDWSGSNWDVTVTHLPQREDMLKLPISESKLKEQGWCRVPEYWAIEKILQTVFTEKVHNEKLFEAQAKSIIAHLKK